VACIILGKRAKLDPETYKPANVSYVVIGGSIVWFGWFGFNGGAAGSANQFAILAATNTQIACASGFVTFLFLDWLIYGKPTTIGAFSGAIIALVAVTPAAGFINIYCGWAFGIIPNMVCFATLYVKKRWIRGVFPGFDDSLDVFVAHGVAGSVGSIMVGFFASKAANSSGGDGVFFGGGALLGWQFIALAFTWGVSISVTATLLLVLKYTIGIRLTGKEELLGADSMHVDKASVADRPAIVSIGGEVQDSDKKSTV